MDNKNELQIQDAEIVAEKTNPAEINGNNRPYILCALVKPNQPAIADVKDVQGLKLNMMANGNLDPECIRDFIMEANMTLLDNRRTHVMTARLRNNFIIAETVTASDPHVVDEKVAKDILIQRIFNKVHDYMMFLWMTATVSDNKILAEFAEAGKVPVDVEEAINTGTVNEAPAEGKPAE